MGDVSEAITNVSVIFANDSEAMKMVDGVEGYKIS